MSSLAAAQAAAAALNGGDPVAPPVNLDEVKRNLKIEMANEDALLGDLLLSALDEVERLSGQILSARTVTQTVDRFDGWIDLFAWPVRAITRIDYIARDGTPLTLTGPDFMAALTRRPVRILAGLGRQWPAIASTAGAVTVTVEAGYSTPDEVPHHLKRAVIALVTHWYQDRESGDVPAGIVRQCRLGALRRV